MGLRLRTWRAAAAAILLAGAAFAQEFKDIESRISDFTLKNGMKFIVLERHSAPVATYLTLADVGSVQETKGITGLAHIFEHMAFKGTTSIGTTDAAKERLAIVEVDKAFVALRAEKVKGKQADPARLKELDAKFRDAQETAGKYVVKNEFGDIIERAGGRGLNASTSWDRTNYFFSLPSNSSELWFFLESERFRDPVLREFYKERDVVMEERRMRTESNPIGKLIEEFLSVAYKAHAYGEPVVGHMSDLESITRADGEVFFKKYYAPSNLVSVVAGDVDPKHIRQLAETYFGRLPSAPKPPAIRTVEPPQEGERRVSLELQSQRLAIMGYHKPDINHPDNAAYSALSSLLSDGRSSRLYRSLVRDKKVAVAAGGFPGFPGQKYPGLFLFYGFTAQNKSNADVEKAIDEEIDKLTKELVTREELDGVKRRVRAGLMRQFDNNMTLALMLSDYQNLTGDWRNLFRNVEKIDAVTPQDILRIAKATFVKSNRTVGTIEPLQTAQAK